MYAPACDDEITGLVSYLDQQLAPIRAAAIGLTEEQARHAAVPQRPVDRRADQARHLRHAWRRRSD